MDIKVASASSLFKENGHDLKGIFNLFYNAVYAYISLTVVNMHTEEYGIASLTDNRELVSGYIGTALENFHPDVEKAASRIAQFNQEYKELKEMEQKINEMRRWKTIFRSFKQIKAYIKRKREIESETVTIEELLNIAYYKFSQVNGTFKQFKDGMKRFLEMK